MLFDSIQTFQWKDLRGKTVEILSNQSEEGLVIVAKDIETGKMYLVQNEIIEETKGLDWKQLYAVQYEFEQYLIKKKNLDPELLVQEKYLSLLVEIGELANKWKEFKYWYNNKRTDRLAMLDEYADCIKCLLVIGLHYGFATNFEGYKAKFDITVIKMNNDLPGRLAELFNDLFETVVKLRIRPNPMIYVKAWEVLLTIGSRLEFTEVEIVNAFFTKDRENYNRQESGY